MKNKLLRMLIIEDSDDDALLIIRQLEKGGYHIEHRQVSTRRALKNHSSKKTGM